MNQAIKIYGEYEGMEYWIVEYNPVLPLHSKFESSKQYGWYFAYVKLNFIDTNFIDKAHFDNSTMPANHYISPISQNDRVYDENLLIYGWRVYTDVYDDVINVNGGVSFGVSNEKETIIGWDYNHFWNHGIDESLEDIENDIKHTITKLNNRKDEILQYNN